MSRYGVSKRDVWRSFSSLEELDCVSPPASLQAIVKIKRKKRGHRWLPSRWAKKVITLKSGLLVVYKGGFTDDVEISFELQRPEIRKDGAKCALMFILDTETIFMKCPKYGYSELVHSLKEHQFYKRRQWADGQLFYVPDRPLSLEECHERLCLMREETNHMLRSFKGALGSLQQALQSLGQTFEVLSRCSNLNSSPSSEESGNQSDDEQSSSPTISSKRSLRPALVYKRRLNLPARPPPPGTLSKVQIVKDIAAGTKTQLPLNIYEPLSMLQVLCELLTHSHLVVRALQESDPLQRMALVAAFVISGYSGKHYRSRKPFQPVLGETYELDGASEFGWRFHSEQVAVAPFPCSAAHADGDGWTWSASLQFKHQTKAIQGAIEFMPVGKFILHLTSVNEAYEWSSPTIGMYNIFNPTTRYSSPQGPVTVACSNGLRCDLNFQKAPSVDSSAGAKVNGVVRRDAEKLIELRGHCSDTVTQRYKGQDTTLLKPTECDKTQYAFTPFTMKLNEIIPKDHVPCTDSRCRPDQRNLELGLIGSATECKRKIEAKQRDRLKAMQESKTPYRPLWFANVNGVWKTRNTYWTAKQNQFHNVKLPDLW